MSEGYYDFRFMLMPEDDGACRATIGRRDDIGEAAMDRIANAFLDAVEKEGYCAGGSFGPSQPEELECQRCEGVGVVDPIPEERKCPTCDGSGEVDPDSMSKEEWNELYDESSCSSKDRATVS